MKIVNVNIVSFGKLVNVSLDFETGINVINNSNGFGKTTLACFVRALLYGINYSYCRVGDERINDVTRFSPWGGTGKFGGSMTVLHEGEQYRIERFFGATAKTETLRVTRLSVGKDLPLSVSPGEYFLGLTADSYDRSAYFPQEAVELASNENLEARLANLVDSADYDKVQSKLTAFRRQKRAARGVGGTIPQLEDKRLALHRKLVEAQQAEKDQQERVRQYAHNNVQLTQLKQQKTDVTAKIDQLNRQLADNTMSVEEQRLRERLAACKESLLRCPAELENDKVAADNIAQQVADAKAKHPETVDVKHNPLLFVVAAVLMIAAIALQCVSLSVVAVICAVAAVACAVVAFCQYIKVQRINKENANVATLQATELDHLVTDYFRVVSRYVDVIDKDYDQVRKEFWQYYNNYQSDKQLFVSLQAECDKISKRDVAPISKQIDSLNATLQKIDQSVESLTLQQGRLNNAIDSAAVVDKAAIEEKIIACDNDIAVETDKYNTAGTVSELLAQAKENLSCSYLPKLRNRISQLVRFVTDGAYDVSLDRDFAVKMVENGQTKQLAAFSRGIREIVLLCFRVALSELLYDGNVPIVIVDDAFVNYDDANFARATSLLKQLAASGTQVIYFTCHDRAW